MAATYRSASQNAARAAGTTGLSITKPSGVADGDVLVAFVGWGDDLGTWACSGWTLLDSNQSSRGNDIGSGVLYKVITNAAGEPSSYTFTNGESASQNMAGFIVCASDVDTSSPIDNNSSNTGTNDWTPTHVNITTNVDGCLVLFFHVGNIGTASAKTAGALDTPSGTTLVGSIAQSRTTNNYVAAECARYDSSVAESIVAGAWTGSPDDTASEWHVYSVSIAPVQAEQHSGSAAITGGGSQVGVGDK